MTEADPLLARLASSLGAVAIRFDRPRASRRAVVAPPVWILDLGGFRSWGGSRTWATCFGKGAACLEDPDDPGRTICAEAIVARRLESAGYVAGWLSTYRAPPPPNWTPRLEFPEATQIVRRALPALAEIVGHGGTPDVFGYRGGGDIVFIEVKRDPDKLSETQADWFTAALAAGLPAERLLLAEWAAT